MQWSSTTRSPPFPSGSCPPLHVAATASWPNVMNDATMQTRAERKNVLLLIWGLPFHFANPLVTRQDLVTELRRINRCIAAHARDDGRRPFERRVPQTWRIVRKAARPRLLVLVISLELTAIPERDLDTDATGQFSLVTHIEPKKRAIDVLPSYLGSVPTEAAYTRLTRAARVVLVAGCRSRRTEAAYTRLTRAARVVLVAGCRSCANELRFSKQRISLLQR